MARVALQLSIRVLPNLARVVSFLSLLGSVLPILIGSVRRSAKRRLIVLMKEWNGGRVVTMRTTTLGPKRNG